MNITPAAVPAAAALVVVVVVVLMAAIGEMIFLPLSRVCKKMVCGGKNVI